MLDTVIYISFIYKWHIIYHVYYIHICVYIYSLELHIYMTCKKMFQSINQFVSRAPFCRVQAPSGDYSQNWICYLSWVFLSLLIWHKLEFYLRRGPSVEKMLPSGSLWALYSTVFWLMTLVGAQPPGGSVIPGHWSWVIQENRLSKAWRTSQ